MSAETFAIISALSFASGTFVLRRAVLNVRDATAGVLVSLLIGLPLFIIVLIIIGQVNSIANFSWQSYAWFSAAGFVQFVLGRSLYNQSVKAHGANIAQVMVRIHPLVTIILGVSMLNEQLTWHIVAGALLIVCGVVMMVLNPQMLRHDQGIFSGISRKTFLIGISAGLCWGISPILIKFGLAGSSSPVAGVFISYTTAIIILGLSLLNRNRRISFTTMNSRATGLFTLNGFFSSVAQILNFTALSMAPASVVIPIFSISPLFILILSFLFNRKLEVFTVPVIAGTIAVIAGAILLV